MSADSNLMAPPPSNNVGSTVDIPGMDHVSQNKNDSALQTKDPEPMRSFT